VMLHDQFHDVEKLGFKNIYYITVHKLQRPN
jgi:hypothetical protein